MKNDVATNFVEKIICSNCGSLTDSNSVICFVCNGIISQTSTIDPVQSVREEGRLYRNLTTSKPKFIVLFGVWVMFLPTLLASLGGAGFILLNGIGSGIGGFIGFWILLALAYASCVFLFRVTRNYFALAPREKDEWD